MVSALWFRGWQPGRGGARLKSGAMSIPSSTSMLMSRAAARVAVGTAPAELWLATQAAAAARAFDLSASAASTAWRSAVNRHSWARSAAARRTALRPMVRASALTFTCKVHSLGLVYKPNP